jgi:hypothetical protein
MNWNWLFGDPHGCDKMCEKTKLAENNDKNLREKSFSEQRRAREGYLRKGGVNESYQFVERPPPPSGQFSNLSKEKYDKLTDSFAQPTPVKNDLPAVKDLVVTDISERAEFGLKKYGTYLQPNNGRDFLIDAYQEALDLVHYLRGLIYERDGK